MHREKHETTTGKEKATKVQASEGQSCCPYYQADAMQILPADFLEKWGKSLAASEMVPDNHEQSKNHISGPL